MSDVERRLNRPLVEAARGERPMDSQTLKRFSTPI